MHKISNPIAHIGIIGGGQLGRMMVMAARRLGCAVSVIDPTPNSPAGQVADQQIVATFDNQQAMRSLVECCDVTTFEIETIDVSDLIELEKIGHAIYPSPCLLADLQDKLVQKQKLKIAGLPTADFVDAGDNHPINFSQFGYPLVQKARRGGYDGRGVVVLKTEQEYERHLPVPSYIERFVQAEKELSVLVARGRKGEVECYPVVEMIVSAEHNVLDTLLAPARVTEDVAQNAKNVATRAIEAIDGVGVFGVELFLTKSDDISINEIAPRTHNSGHHTLEASVTDQFEQHLRAVLGLPLGSARQISPAAMVNLLGESSAAGATVVRGLEDVLAIPGANFHLYGKLEVKPFRKMGHVTIVDESLENAIEKARAVRDLIRIEGDKKYG